MFNIFEKLARSQDTVSDEEQARRDRIEFHRTSVRNGPVSWKTQTNGQVKRGRKRAAARQQKKAYRTEVRNHFARLRQAAIVRTHLQVVGLIPFIDGHEEPLEKQAASTLWIAANYGESFEHDDILAALRKAAAAYSRATGHIVTVPAGFEPAIAKVA